MEQKEISHRYYCKHKEKINIYCKEYYIKNKEKRKLYHRKYYEEHRQHIKIVHKRYVNLHKKEIADKKKEWHKKHQQQLYIKYKDKRKKYFRYYQKQNQEKFRYWSAQRRILKNNAKGYHTLEEWLLIKKQYNYICPACGKKEPDIKLTEDHIIPISKNGTNFIDNIQPLCKSCNSKKGTKIIHYKINTF